MAQRTLIVQYTSVERVQILSTRVSRDKTELMIGLDQDWDDISSDMKHRLFQEASELAKLHPTLAEGWTPHFYHKVN